MPSARSIASSASKPTPWNWQRRTARAAGSTSDNSDADDSRLANRFHLPQFIEDCFGYRRCRRLVDDGDARGAVALAAEREIRDVHAVAAENRADVADDARLVGVAEHDHRAFERRFDGDAVKSHETGNIAFEHRPFYPAIALGGVELHRDQARVVA